MEKSILSDLVTKFKRHSLNFDYRVFSILILVLLVGISCESAEQREKRIEKERKEQELIRKKELNWYKENTQNIKIKVEQINQLLEKDFKRHTIKNNSDFFFKEEVELKPFIQFLEYKRKNNKLLWKQNRKGIDSFLHKIEYCVENSKIDSCYIQFNREAMKNLLELDILLLEEEKYRKAPSISDSKTFESGIVTYWVTCYDLRKFEPFYRYEYTVQNNEEVYSKSNNGWDEVKKDLENDLRSQALKISDEQFIKYFPKNKKVGFN